MEDGVTLLPEAGPEEMLGFVEKKKRHGKRHFKSFYESTIRKIKEELNQTRDDAKHVRLTRRLERFEKEYQQLKRDYARSKRRTR